MLGPMENLSHMSARGLNPRAATFYPHQRWTQQFNPSAVPFYPMQKWVRKLNPTAPIFVSRVLVSSMNQSEVPVPQKTIMKTGIAAGTTINVDVLGKGQSRTTEALNLSSIERKLNMTPAQNVDHLELAMKNRSVLGLDLVFGRVNRALLNEYMDEKLTCHFEGNTP